MRAGATAFLAVLTLASTPPAQAEEPRGVVEAIVPVALPPWAPPAPTPEVTLGARLFADRRLSRGDRLACSSCHDVQAAGADPSALSPGLDGKPLRRNTPTVFNAALSSALGWTGGFADLEAQAAALIVDPGIMGADWDEVIGKLAADIDLHRGFVVAYGTGPTRANVAAALAAYERTLLTPGSRFDRYLQGDAGALASAEVKGYELFKEVGCVSCHQGRNIGGNLFQRFGVFETPAASRRGDDPGRLGITGRQADLHVFRVPSLRNVAVTPPYFHHGGVASLSEAVTVMARSQLGRSLEPEAIELIVAFLGTLTGSYNGRPLKASPRP